MAYCSHNSRFSPIIFKVGVLGSRSKYGWTQWDQPNFFKLGKKKDYFWSKSQNWGLNTIRSILWSKSETCDSKSPNIPILGQCATLMLDRSTGTSVLRPGLVSVPCTRPVGLVSILKTLIVMYMYIMMTGWQHAANW